MSGWGSFIFNTEGTIMLVLSRAAGERILIGDDVAIIVVRIGPNSVRIGIEAPSDVPILREEIKDRPEPQQAVMPRRR